GVRIRPPRRLPAHGHQGGGRRHPGRGYRRRRRGAGPTGGVPLPHARLGDPDHGDPTVAELEKGRKLRVLTGDRPTGRLHLGHWVGSLANRVRLQDTHECYFIIADLHTLTPRPDKESIAELPDNIREMILDYLAVGIDPDRSTIFVQSAVPEVAELNLILGMLVTLPRLERIP